VVRRINCAAGWATPGPQGACEDERRCAVVVQQTNLEVDGVPVYVEVTRAEMAVPAGDAELAWGGNRLPSPFKVESVGKAAAAAVRAIHADLMATLGPAMPDTLGLEFGLTVSGEGGLSFKAGASSEFTISAKWDLAARRQQPV